MNELRDLIMLEAKNGRIKRVKELIGENKLDVNARFNGGKTLLMEFCEKGNIDIVNILIEKGADINLQDDEGNTALHIALGRGNYGNVHNRISQVLIGNGADISIKNNEGKTALEYIYLMGRRGYMDLIMSLAVDKDYKNIEICIKEYCKLVNKHELLWEVNDNLRFINENSLNNINISISNLDNLKDCLSGVKKRIKNTLVTSSIIEKDNIKKEISILNKYLESVNNLQNQYMISAVVLPESKNREFNK